MKIPSLSRALVLVVETLNGDGSKVKHVAGGTGGTGGVRGVRVSEFSKLRTFQILRSPF